MSKRRTRYSLCAKMHGGSEMRLTTQGTLSTGGTARTFGSMSAVKSTLRIIRRVLGSRARDFEFYARTQNPSGFARARDGYLAELDKAADAYQTFTGRAATKEKVFRAPQVRTGFELGPLVAVTYAANRGDGYTHFEHTFKKNSRPLLVASSDGKSLAVVGGRFAINPELGIVDNDG